MNKHKLIVVGCILALMLAVGIVSARQNVTQTVALAQSAEAQAVGGLSTECWRALGVTTALFAAGVGGCEVLCFCLGWYSIGAVAVYCG
jgi:hypothetical protein